MDFFTVNCHYPFVHVYSYYFVARIYVHNSEQFIPSGESTNGPGDYRKQTHTDTPAFVFRYADIS